MSSEAITRNDLTNILNEIVAIDGTDMTAQEISDFVDSLNCGGGIHIGSDYIKIGSLGACWGTGTPSSINSQNAITFPITFLSAPTCFATFQGDAKGSTYAVIKCKSVTTTGMTVYYYESGGSVYNYSWLAIGQV